MPPQSPKSGKLPRSFSLKSRLEIARIVKTGQKFTSECFTARWLESDQFEFAILISKKHGTAIERNRLKRLYREAIRLLRNELSCSLKIVFLPGYKCEQPQFRQVYNEIARLIKKLNSDLR